MQRILRGPPKAGLALALGVVVALCVGCGTSGLPIAKPADAAQTNLQTALAGAGAFYSSNHDSYLGIDGGPQLAPGVSSIAELDTGLRYVSGRQGSTGPDIISIVALSSWASVMSAYSPGLQACYGLLIVTRARARPYLLAFPSTTKAATFYFKAASSASTNCAAARVVPTALSTTGFPAG